RLVVRAEVALAAPADTDPERLRDWARDLRGTGGVPCTGDNAAVTEELLGVETDLAARPRPLWRRVGPLAP
ncbi:FUSC family protein, partial [Streptomyces sp. TRM76130]|nr:FUSC family protein [Streptomyces sp. TRM76130]